MYSYNIRFFSIFRKLVSEFLLEEWHKKDHWSDWIKCISLQHLQDVKDSIDLTIKASYDPNKFTPNQVDEMLDDYMKNYAASLKNMSAEEFDRYKTLFKDSTEETPMYYIYHEFYENCDVINKIKENSFRSNIKNDYDSIISSLELDDLLEFVQDHVINFRKINFHLINVSDEGNYSR